MGQKIAGTCYIKADGMQFEVTGSVEVSLYAVKRESVLPGFYKEEELTPYVKLEALFTRDFSIDTLSNSVEMTVTAELANGKNYVLTGAYLVGDNAAKVDEGKLSLEFNDKKGIWQ